MSWFESWLLRRSEEGKLIFRVDADSIERSFDDIKTSSKPGDTKDEIDCRRELGGVLC